MKKVILSLIICTVFICDDSLFPNQDSSIWYVEVVEKSSDTVGRRLVYHVKESIRNSSAMQLTAMNVPRVRIRINTMPKYDDNPNIATMYSVIWLFDAPELSLPYYISSTLGYCGTDVVVESAEDVVANTDALLSSINKMANDEYR